MQEVPFLVQEVGHRLLGKFLDLQGLVYLLIDLYLEVAFKDLLLHGNLICNQGLVVKLNDFK
jgi:hypothetical protein